MQPVLLTQTIFANRYFLLHQPDSLVISDGQVWVVRDYQANCQVLLWTFPTVNSRQAGVFKSNLASYQQVDSPGLLPLLDYGVSADDIPYLVTDDWVVTTGLTHPVIADDEQLASLLKQLTETVLALHQQSLSPTRLDAETIIVNEIQNQYQLLPLIKPIDKRADLANLIALSETLSPDSPATKWLKEQTNERDLTVEQINQVTNQYYISKEWKLPEVPKPEVVAEPTDTESTSEPVKTEPSGGTTGDYSNKNKWLMGVGISVALLLIILLIAQNWPKKRVEIQTGSTKLDRTLKDTSTTKGENLPPSPLPNFSEQYRSLL
uniref:hypothetical protein n=1 Tax=Spirosoma sp. TaxID=1899569 RepID=UPI003B3B841E